MGRPIAWAIRGVLRTIPDTWPFAKRSSFSSLLLQAENETFAGLNAAQVNRVTASVSCCQHRDSDMSSALFHA